MNQNQHYRIGLLIERTRAFGRGVLEGIISAFDCHKDIEISLLDPSALPNKRKLAIFDGFIARVTTDALAKRLAATERPVVDLYYSRPRPGFIIVKTRHETIGRLAAEHFLKRHFQHFAYCPVGNDRTSIYCGKAFCRRLKRAGFNCEVYSGKTATYHFGGRTLVDECFTPASDAHHLSKWLLNLPKPIALFTPGDIRAWQITNLASENRLSIPNDIAILGLDNDLIVCGACRPMLSSIDPDANQIGHIAAETLLDAIEGRIFKREIIRQIEPKGVITRSSTELYPVSPKWVSDALVYIEANLAKGISATDVYAFAGKSHTTVNQAFINAIGESVQKAITEFRIERAKRLLRNTQLPISDIGTQCGFMSPTYFSQAFFAATGNTPGNWRMG